MGTKGLGIMHYDGAYVNLLDMKSSVDIFIYVMGFSKLNVQLVVSNCHVCIYYVESTTVVVRTVAYC